ncbi:unnamed protein product [Spirodela intermedia]|uniref:Uncharacterized protein n=1 Tax=Spirodela intermedia TaxID=51605 RepID=A0A7I8KZV8_SPIIN|nr:unnamed protein product [Spirodela intermedia]
MVFNQFQLGELKETLIVLQLVDSLVKTPQSLLEDVIIDISLLKMIYVMHQSFWVDHSLPQLR